MFRGILVKQIIFVIQTVNLSLINKGYGKTLKKKNHRVLNSLRHPKNYLAPQPVYIEKIVDEITIYRMNFLSDDLYYIISILRHNTKVFLSFVTCHYVYVNNKL